MGHVRSGTPVRRYRSKRAGSRPCRCLHPLAIADASANPHEVFNQTPPLSDFNAFACDAALSDGVVRSGAAWALQQLAEYGKRTGSAEVTRWGFEANACRPRFASHDRYGRRIDLVEYHESYHRLMSMAMTAGIHSAPWVTPRAGAHVARAALVYLQAQVDAGHGCPLTMTFAAVPTLNVTPAVAREWLPKILANAYDPRNVPYTAKSGAHDRHGHDGEARRLRRARQHDHGPADRIRRPASTSTSSSATSGSLRRRCATRS